MTRSLKTGNKSETIWLIFTIVIMFAFTAIATGRILVGKQNPSQDRGRSAGDSIVVRGDTNVGNATPRERRVIQIPITNSGSQPIRILGCRGWCFMKSTSILPVEIKPKERYQLTIEMEVPERNAAAQAVVEAPITLFTNLPERRTLQVPLSITYDNPPR